MFSDTQPTTPVTVRLDNSTARAPSRDGGQGFLNRAARGLADTLSLAVHAPLLVGLGLSIGAWVGLLVAGRFLVAAIVLVMVAAAGVALAHRHPAGARRLVAVLVGQGYRALVYRPRWEVACHAANLAPRIGTTTHVPGLVRHTRTTHGVDILLVRMAPGQTLTTWQAAAGSLAATFTAHTITARPTDRPGWVLLDVLRRDPLAGETTAPDPARHTPTSTSTTAARPAAVEPSRVTRALTGLTKLPQRAGLPALTTVAHEDDPLGVVLGVDEHGRPLTLNPYTTAHAGMQGATRSGKSSACYTLLAALAHRADVIVCGVDPSGLLLDPFTTDNGGRGGAFIATGTSRDDITRAVTVLTDIVAMMDACIRDLRARGVDKLTTFTPTTPACWVVMEEYPGLLAAAKALDNEAGTKAGDRLAPRLAAALGRIVKEGAKVGIFVLVLAQRMSADALNTDDRMNLALRLTLRVDNGDAVAMLHDGITRDHVHAVRTFAPGVALVESPGTGVRRVRLHYTDYATYRTRVAAGITATAPAPAISSDGTPTVDLVGEVITLPTTDNTAATVTCEEDAA
ncbi:FtsK/SpoIIIE domain-containing protein [Arsenicicoccus bolidensis]|uniref:FtsK/SpoIIIE domain-containing protein n=1 Tax=Arsenicicoccus bolidensis TaxID=229480 RepID=UPI0004926968